MPDPRPCAGAGGCGHVHGGRAYGLCLQPVAAGGVCPCNVVHDGPGGALPSPDAPDLTPDPWLLPDWRRSAAQDCDGCGEPDAEVMHVRGGGGDRHV